MNKWDKVLEEFIGKDKCQSIEIFEGEKGTWIYKFREKINGKFVYNVIELPTRQEAEKFHFHFGGKNPSTISAPDCFTKLGEWRSQDVYDLGHRITEIAVQGEKVTRDKTIPIELPPETGYPYLIGKKKDYRQDTVNLILKDHEGMNISRVFKNSEEFDNFAEFLQTDISSKSLTFYVRSMTTENIDTKDVGKWFRCSAQDGTRRMILELRHINKAKYQDIMYMDILAFADGFVGGECKKIPKTAKKAESTVCYFAAKEGKFD